ncbi:MAG: zinc dependent phospholipase C family protein [Sphingomonadales bacterium]|jgi:hypothetical protein
MRPFKILFFLAVLFFATKANAWGFLGHRLINNRAVFALPPQMFGFYKKHIEYVTQHSVDPDSRRYMMAEEACRHYMDCDRYEKAAPLDTIPHRWHEAIEKYTEDTLLSHGIVPWHCLAMLSRLTKAFEEKNLQKILKLSADIGHYIADAHVPLHSSRNYNGQLTGQEGIHALWESRIPQLFVDSFDLLTGSAVYLYKPSDFIWGTMGRSFMLVDSVLKLERVATAMHPENKFSFEARGTQTMEVYSVPFCNDYHRMMENMVERRMRQAIFSVASFWYTAWVNAGQPNLDALGEEIAPDPEDAEIEKAVKSGQMKGREEHGKD